MFTEMNNPDGEGNHCRTRPGPNHRVSLVTPNEQKVHRNGSQKR